ncbi:hypothetical protein SAMN05216456_1944 [Devosia crocina]|uniref:Mannitol repressor n=1 Tax=Devosia crocina TaxID=429728 RepID=A0A1I7NF62_9HYPH|nr:hypothetical protein [Devosia crocina]SFV33280.1 hypothetical protein SAMN05216456_1944 [Devosia crocina]
MTENADTSEELHALFRAFGASIETVMSEQKTASPRATIMLSMAMIETAIEHTLRLFLAPCPATDTLLNPLKNGALGSFAPRVDMCVSLGLIPEKLAQASKWMAHIRNDYAHKIHVETAQMEHVKKLRAAAAAVGIGVSTLTFHGGYQSVSGMIAMRIAGEWVAISREAQRKIKT